MQNKFTFWGKDWYILFYAILQVYVWYGIHLSVVPLVWQQFFLLVDHLRGSWPHARAELTYSENSVCHFVFML